VRHFRLVALLVTLWILAWGQLTFANLASGVVVTAALLLAFPPRRQRGNVRFNAAGGVRLAAYVAAQLVTSNVVMARQILRRNTARHAGVLAHHLRQPSDEIATLMSSVIALSPGTMTVDVTPDSSIVYVHFFDLRDVEAARASLARLEQRVINAIAVHSRHEPATQHKESP
jgi:multicomponent Na+:H+ antiporter subunit E